MYLLGDVLWIIIMYCRCTFSLMQKLCSSSRWRKAVVAIIAPPELFPLSPLSPLFPLSPLSRASRFPHLSFSPFPLVPLPTISLTVRLPDTWPSRETMRSFRRKRASVACVPCRERKRKCDGGSPCITCTEWGYDCFYEHKHRRNFRNNSRTSSLRSTQNHLPIPHTPSEKNALQGTRSLVQRMESNSGAAFVRKMALKIDSAKAPKLSLFAWNIGARKMSCVYGISSPLPIVQIASLENMITFVNTYFQKLDSCFGFINRHLLFERLSARWQSSVANDLYDCVLGGIAALGCLFSQRDLANTEMQFVQSARSILDMHVLSDAPTLDLISGWALRVIYLRMTSSPHETWMASSTLMHLVEASGFHLGSLNGTILPHSSSQDDLEMRRVYALARHVNTWTSFDLGLTKVAFKDDLPESLPVTPDACMTNILDILPVTTSLDPTSLKDESSLELQLAQILNATHTHPPVILAQSNLVLCILRQLHTQNREISANLMERVLALLRKALFCARNMVMDCSPWHHVANVPFHIICILLAMDNRSSLAMLPEATQALNYIASVYDTETMREACNTAHLLIMLHQQRRRDDVSIFNEALDIYQIEHEKDIGSFPHFDPSAEEQSWLASLVADLPGL